MTDINNITFRFETPVLLFGASPLTENITPHLNEISDLPVLAADGGVRSAMALGMVPQAVIGDMDSLGDVGGLPANIQRIHLSGQDDTDFEKCMRLIEAPLIIGVGFLDGRFDHALAVLNVLARLPRGRRVLLLGTYDTLLRVTGDCKLDLDSGVRLSIWPLWRQAFVRSSGLKWPLDEIDMAAGARTGTSNTVTVGPVSIKAGPGDGYCLIAPLDAFAALHSAALDFNSLGH
jgi:thiamine pyrophosphokinase